MVWYDTRHSDDWMGKWLVVIAYGKPHLTVSVRPNFPTARLWLSSPFVVHVELILERTSCSKLLPIVRVAELNFHSSSNSLHLLLPCHTVACCVWIIMHVCSIELSVRYRDIALTSVTSYLHAGGYMIGTVWCVVYRRKDTWSAAV